MVGKTLTLRFKTKSCKKTGSKATALYEPMAQNTAPAIAYLCRYLEINNQANEVVAIFPSDHLIENEAQFIKIINQAKTEADSGNVVTLGIKPTFPSTGYGYIQTNSQSLNDTHNVIKFFEKPQLQVATEFKKLCPEVWTVAAKIDSKSLAPSTLKAIYAEFPNISIDYAIMEKIDGGKLKCIPCDIGWSDVGSWDAVSGLFKNTNPDYTPIEVISSNNYIHGLKQKIYATIGIHNLIIVDTADALLISQKGLTQEVKTVVDHLKKLNHKVVREHIFEDRPWGRYEILKEENSFKSKVIHVLPGQQLSYQSHDHREEHWIITQGKGEIVLNEEIIPIQRGSYVKIPLKAKHRIKNTGTETIEFIEVQLGSYLGEDDIIRYQDDYQRT